MISEPEGLHVRLTMGFLQDRMRPPDDAVEVIVRRDEVVESGRPLMVRDARRWFGS
jgi:hypothetical protein